MTERAALPALIIAHDSLSEAAAKRARWVAEGSGQKLVTATAADFDAGAAESALEEVGSHDTFLVVHLLGPIEDPGLDVGGRDGGAVADLVGAVARVRQILHRRFPGKVQLDQWLILSVGQVIDEPERQIANQVGALPGVRGVLVTATATHASVTTDADELACFTADLVLALVGSDLERQLAEVEGATWIAGTTSVTYASSRVAAAVSAHLAIELFDEQLLAPVGADDPSFELGEVWVEESLDLLAGKERDLLLRSASGASLLSRVRMRDIDWDSVPFTSWSDVLFTRYQLLASNELALIRRRIEEHRQERLEDLQDAAIANSFEALERAAQIDAARWFGAGACAALDRVDQALPDEAAGVDVDLIERDRKRLRRFTRWLPFGPAVAVRVFAAAVGVLVLVSTVTGPSDRVVLRELSEPWGRLAGVAVLLMGFLLYQRRIAATLRIRDRLNNALEQQLVDTVEAWVVAARRQTIADLVAWIGGTLDEDGELEAPGTDLREPPAQAETLVAWFTWLLVESHKVRDSLVTQVASRADPAGLASRYAVDLPSPDLVSTETLATELFEQAKVVRPQPDDAARTLAITVRSKCSAAELAVVTAAELRSLWATWLVPLIRPRLWTDIGTLLAERPSIRNRARATIEVNTAPGIDSSDNAPQIATRHYLIVPGGRTGQVFAQLFSDDIEPAAVPGNRVSSVLTDVLDGSILDLALMVNLFAVDLDADHAIEPPDAADEDGSTAEVDPT